ncbi:LOW QUALITY PROTEIN: uncharacterized protein J5F26_012407 [Ciconia maguari]
MGLREDSQIPAAAPTRVPQRFRLPPHRGPGGRAGPADARPRSPVLLPPAELQRLAAGVLGMEEALFVPTATMAEPRRCPLYLKPALPDLDRLELTVRGPRGSRYRPRPELICLENAHSPRLPPAGTPGPLPRSLEHSSCRHRLPRRARCLQGSLLAQLPLPPPGPQLADRYGLGVHVDRARLTNAAVAQDVEPARTTQHCDSVSLCFSKGLGAPAGAVLAGRREFVAEARRVRKLLGRGMQQAGVLAAAARLGLEHAEATLRRDHDNAQRFAEGISELNSPLCSVSLAAVKTNIVMANRGDRPSPAKLCEHLRAVSEEELAETGPAVSVLLFPWLAHAVRAVWHRDISARDTELAKNKLEFVAGKCQEKLALGLRPSPPGGGGA